MRARKRFAALTAAILTALSGAALAQEYDAQQAKSWMAQFAQALLQFSPINDPAQTLDPARPGEYLQEYEFGTVQAATSGTPTAAQIEEIDVSTAQVTDARGVRVGMTLSEALGGLSIPQAEGNLAVVSTQETGVGWCWAYLGEDGVYGVEWLTYDLYEPVTEYTLTYVIDGDTVSGIRVKAAASTRAQAEAGLATAQEIAGRQKREAVLTASGAAMFGADDLTVNGRAVIGAEAYVLVQALGEPNEVQTLPAGGGRILLYDGAAVRLGLDEATGAEVVLGVTATGDIPGSARAAGRYDGAGGRGAFPMRRGRVCIRRGALYRRRGLRRAAVCRNERGKRRRGDDPLPLPNGKRRGRAAGRGHSRRGRRLLAFVHGRGGGRR